MPINAAFWGPDPVFSASPLRSFARQPSEEEVPPELSNDPLVAEEAWR